MVMVLVAVLLGYGSLGAAGAFALAMGGVLIAALGLADDVWELSARSRLLIQALVIGGVLWVLGAVGVIQNAAGGLGAWPGWLIGAFLLLAVLWFTNLFNFMDGIDGIAAAQSASFCLAALICVAGDPGWLSGVLWAGFASSLGFAVFNLAPARIFMGDVGSAFWGFLLAFLALQLDLLGHLPLVASLVLLSAFWFDASYTLCVRIVTGQRFTEGHRSHLYQRLAGKFGHGPTTAGYVLLFVAWQWPLAWWSRNWYLSDLAEEPAMAWLPLDLRLWWLVLLACAPLLVGCVWLRAGQADGYETRVTIN